MTYMIFETSRDNTFVDVEMQKLDSRDVIQIQLDLYQGTISARVNKSAPYMLFNDFLDLSPGVNKIIENELYGFIRGQNYPIVLAERHVKRSLPVPHRKEVVHSNPNPSPNPAPVVPAAMPRVTVDRKAIEAEIQNSLKGLLSQTLQKNLRLNPSQCKSIMAAYNNPGIYFIVSGTMGQAARYFTGADKTYFKGNAYDELVALLQNQTAAAPAPSPNPAPATAPAVPTRAQDLVSLQSLVFPSIDSDAHVVNKSFVRNNKDLVFRAFKDDFLFKQSFNQLVQNRENIRQEFSNFLKQDPRYQGDAHYKTAVDNVFGGYWTTDKESKETGGVSLQDMMLMIYALLKRRATLDHCPLTDTPAYGFLMLQLEDQSKTCFEGAIARMFSAFAMGMREFYARRGS